VGSLSFAASNSRAVLSGAPLFTSLPFSAAGWIRPINVSSIQTLFYVGTKHATSANDSHRLLINTDGSLRLNTRNAAGSGGVAIGSVLTANTWYHVGGVVIADNIRRVFTNGAPILNTANFSVNPFTGLALGATMVSSAFGNNYTGFMENWAVWNIALTDGEMMALAQGVQPCHIRPQSLTYWWRNMGTLVSATSVPDIRGREALTGTNTAVAAEAPVQRAMRPRLGNPYAAVSAVARPRIVLVGF